MNRISEYPHVRSLGHPQISELLERDLDGDVFDITVTEKVDGSQFSFGMLHGQFHMRSKGQEIQPGGPETMFAEAETTVVGLVGAGVLLPDAVYRCEYLRKPKHNTLAYSRVPVDHLVVFDVEIGASRFLPFDDAVREAGRIGLEFVPRFDVSLTSSDALMSLLERESFLGGQRIEGVVVKNYARFGRDGKILCGKFVSEAFKERHSREWKKSNPGSRDIVQSIITENRTDARWRKAAEHLRDRGELEFADRDIGKIIKEIHRDIDEECREVISQQLWKWASGNIKRGVAGGVAEWWKRTLAERQFETAEPADVERVMVDRDTGTPFAYRNQFEEPA